MFRDRSCLFPDYREFLAAVQIEVSSYFSLPPVPVWDTPRTFLDLPTLAALIVGASGSFH